MTQAEKDINFKRPDFETGNIKPTLQKKLDDLGDRLNKNSICKLNSCSARFNRDEVARIYGKDSRPHLLGYCSAGCYTFSKDSPLKNEIDHPHDYYEKGKLFDALKKEHEALKKQRDELLEFCKKLYKTLNEAQKRCGGNSSYGDIFTVYFAKGNNIGERLKQLINNK